MASSKQVKAPPATYEEYRKVYSKYKDLYGTQVAVFYQVGSFFELYDVVNKSTAQSWCNVKDVIDILGIQLSIKSEPDAEAEQLFAGFPDYTLHRWASKLTQLGWTVVVVEQRKDSRGKVETREVTRVLSPGTHCEQASAAEAPFVAAIWLQESPNHTPKYGLSAIDLTTGTITSYEGQTRGKHNVWSADEGLHFFQVYSPKEIILYWRGDNFSQPSEGTVRRIFGLTKQPIHFRQALPSQQGGLEGELVREEFLKKHFKPQTLLPVREYLHISKQHLIERSLCCLLRFLEDHFSSGLGALKDHMPWNPSTKLECGNNALAQLNFVSDSVNDSVIGIFNKCITAMGKRAIRTRLLSPLTKKSEIEARLNRIDSFMDGQNNQQEQVEKSLSFMFDLPRLHRKVMNFNVSGGDLVGLYQSYKEIATLSQTVQENLFTIPKQETVRRVLTSWESYFSLQKAEKANDNISFLRPGVSPAVDALEKSIQDIYDSVNAWLVPFGQPDLRIEEKDKIPITIRAPKQVIQTISVREKPKGAPYQGLECRQTKSVGHSLEAPFLENVNEKILVLRSRLAEAVRDILPTVCTEFYNTCGAAWQEFEEFVEEIDCSYCIAKVSKERGFYKPTILDNSDGSSIRVKHLRHPLIEALSTRTQYVTHDVTFDSENYGWLLYGMNASGKSSLMKAIGIAVLLAQCGSYVPAREMELAPFERLLTRILNVDNLWAGLSSFAVEVSELRDIFLRADPKTLVLGDELCSGTESVSATALVASGITYLLNRQSRFVFATHYHDLFKLQEIRDAKGLAVWHLKVRYDPGEDILIYERTLSPGPGSTLYGIEVAKALGMPFEVLDNATKFRRALQGERVEEELTRSAWNNEIVARKCEMCGAAISRDLEVHHIRPRAEADGRRFEDDGLGRDSARNLAVVCVGCHDKHHSGQKPISPLMNTSRGALRTPEKKEENILVRVTKTTNKLSSEQTEIVQKMIRDFPNLTLNMIRNKLLKEYEIVITEGSLRKTKGERDLQQD